MLHERDFLYVTEKTITGFSSCCSTTLKPALRWYCLIRFSDTQAGLTANRRKWYIRTAITVFSSKAFSNLNHISKQGKKRKKNDPDGMVQFMKTFLPLGWVIILKSVIHYWTEKASVQVLSLCCVSDHIFQSFIALWSSLTRYFTLKSMLQIRGNYILSRSLACLLLKHLSWIV